MEGLGIESLMLLYTKMHPGVGAMWPISTIRVLSLTAKQICLSLGKIIVGQKRSSVPISVITTSIISRFSRAIISASAKRMVWLTEQLLRSRWRIRDNHRPESSKLIDHVIRVWMDGAMFENKVSSAVENGG